MSWPLIRLGDVLEINPSEASLSEDAPFVPMDAVAVGQRHVQYTEPRGKRGGVRAREGDILFARITPCLQNGKVAIVQSGIGRCGGSTEFIVLRAGDRVHTGFVYQWVTAQSVRERLASLMVGATGRQRLNAEVLAKELFPLPPLKEQERIVALLDEATDAVTELEAVYSQTASKLTELRSSALAAEIERLGSAPTQSLDDLCAKKLVQLGRGKVISKRDLAASPGTYPVYSSAKENEGKFGEYGNYMFDEEMITWSIDGGGRLFYRPKHRFSVTNVGGTLRVLDPAILNVRFLHQVLIHLHSTRVFDWVFKAHPSVIRKVYDTIPVPTLQEQQSMVARMGLVDQLGVEALKLVSLRLDAARSLRQSILESAFRGEL